MEKAPLSIADKTRTDAAILAHLYITNRCSVQLKDLVVIDALRGAHGKGGGGGASLPCVLSVLAFIDLSSGG
jgi:hypothetical protein